MSRDHYKVKYVLQPESGRFTADECAEAGGGCDAFVLVSILHPEDGGYSQAVVSFDGRSDGAPLTDADLWKVWSMLGAQLAGSANLREEWPNRHALADEVHERIRGAILSGRDGGLS